MHRVRSTLANVAAAAFAVVPSAAHEDETRAEDGRFVLGFQLQVTGPDTTAGTFVASGAVQDAGASTVEHITVVPLGHHDQAQITGDQTFTGARGSIATRFTEIVEDSSSQHSFARGTFEIISGTGAYAGVSGDGTLLVVVDLSGSTHLIGTEEGRLR
jgi:hypothetical protein